MYIWTFGIDYRVATLSKSYLIFIRNQHNKFEIDRTILTCLNNEKSYSYPAVRMDVPSKKYIYLNSQCMLLRG